MAIPSFTEDMDIISALGDRPNTDDGLTPSQLKAKFDLAGNRIKTYINTVLLPKLIEKPSFTGLMKSSAGNISSAVEGTDYQAPLTAGTDYQTPLIAGTDYQTPLIAGTDYLTPNGASAAYEPLLSSEKKRRIYYGTATAAEYYAAQGLTAETGDIYIQLPDA